MDGTILGYVIFAVIFSLVGVFVKSRLQSRFRKYNSIPIRNGMSGAEVAYKMLNDSGIRDVRIVPVRGSLTDHYNPKTKTISLSESVHHSRSVGAAAVAAHETGHAIQHSTSYRMLGMRSALVPIVQYSARAQQVLFMIVIFGLSTGIFGNLLLATLTVTLGITALFSLVTLPVEFDASKRALAWLDQSGISQGSEFDGAKDALWWAAMTYVAQAFSALVMFLYFLFQFLGNRR